MLPKVEAYKIDICGSELDWFVVINGIKRPLNPDEVFTLREHNSGHICLEGLEGASSFRNEAVKKEAVSRWERDILETGGRLPSDLQHEEEFAK
jgi:hypothetical protein